jgi:uncharacterized protein YbgA (DUF1722 family)/uncharacterized protein YbbK (DUF523 family)
VITVCPEEQIGLGTPRPTLQLVSGDGVRLWQPATERDHTVAMQHFSDGFVATLDVDAAILKSRSPSCAILDAKLHADDADAAPIGQAPGLFAAELLRRHPHVARIDEGRLLNAELRHHFFTWTFTRWRFRMAVQSGEIAQLQDFQARHKYLLMAQSEAHLRELGRILASHRRGEFDRVRSEYELLLHEALETASTPSRHVNVLHHCFGHVSEQLTPAERQHFLRAIERYRDGSMPLSALLLLLHAWALRSGDEYLLQQFYLDPYPSDLMSRGDSSKDSGPRAAL